MTDAGRSPGELVAPSAAEGDIRAVGKAISGLGTKDSERVGRHPTLGDMSLWDFGDHCTVGHYVEHADQLDELIEEVR